MITQQTRNIVSGMSWWEFVTRVAGAGRQRDITDVTGIDATEVTRWKNEGKTPSPQKAAAFARGYGVPVLEAFLAAGFLTADEAGQPPAAEPDWSSLGNDDLLALVRDRMREPAVPGRPIHHSARTARDRAMRRSADEGATREVSGSPDQSADGTSTRNAETG